VLNIQLGCPRHFDSTADHYVVIDFRGWRYFELIEPEGDRFEDYSWPYGRCVYKVYREFLDYGQIESGCYLEFRSMDDCKLYSPQGHVLAAVHPQGPAPVLAAGENRIEFTCTPTAGLRARAHVTIIGQADTFLSR